MTPGKQSDLPTRTGPPLVQAIVKQLRSIILESPPGSQIGSLHELAEKMSVGIVTVQQASRILEHEGLLQVRRGPGGGYFGSRPDKAALERSLGSYLTINLGSHREMFEMMTLLDIELMPDAARCSDEALRTELRELQDRLEQCDVDVDRIAFEEQLHSIVFRMVGRPLYEVFARVAAHVSRVDNGPTQFPASGGAEAWIKARLRMIQAILDGDAGLAKFEADRHRQALLSALNASCGEMASASAACMPS